MPCFFNKVTELKNLKLPNLILKVACFNVATPKEEIYLKDHEVVINEHREVSSEKYCKIASSVKKKFHRSIELRVFIGKRFCGVVLNPEHIRDYVRITFEKHKNYETTGNVLVKGIAKKDLQKPSRFIRRRGFHWFSDRDAFYDKLPMTDIAASTDEVPSPTSMGSGQPSDEQTPTHQIPSSTLTGSGQPSAKQTPTHQVSPCSR